MPSYEITYWGLMDVLTDGTVNWDSGSLNARLLSLDVVCLSQGVAVASREYALKSRVVSHLAPRRR